jgi:hypothetical protein
LDAPHANLRDVSQPSSPSGTGTWEGLLSSSKQIFQNTHFSILVNERMSVVVTRRGEKPFTSVEELEAIFADFANALDRLDRARYALVADIRAAPGRNDPLFEPVMQRLSPRWLGGFRKVGVLVKSTAGLLQAQRYARKDGISRLTSNDEAEMFRYLTDVQ